MIYRNQNKNTWCKIYTNFRGLNVPEDQIECESFTECVTSIYLLLVCKIKYYLEVFLDNSAYKFANKQMTDYLDGNIFETD